MAVKATAENQNDTNEELLKRILEQANELKSTNPAAYRAIMRELGQVPASGIDVATVGMTHEMKELLANNDWKAKVVSATGLAARGFCLFLGGRWAYGKIFG